MMMIIVVDARGWRAADDIIVNGKYCSEVDGPHDGGGLPSYDARQ